MIQEPEELASVLPLRTERLVLRPFTVAELEAVTEGAQLPQFAPGFPTLLDQDWARVTLDAGSHYYVESAYTVLALVDVASAQIVGTGGFSGPPIDQQLEVVGSVVPARQGEGLAAEALAALLDLGFRNPHITAMCGSASWENEPARKVLLSNGFTPQESRGHEAVYILPRPQRAR